MRVFATGNGRKTDPVDAHSVAIAALHAANLNRVEVDADLAVLGMLADRRDELGRARTQTINRLHRLLLELFPGGAKKFLSATQARALIATIKPRDPVSKTRRRLVVELMDLRGIGPSSAARLLADVGDIHRFRDRDQFASWNGTAPWTPPPVNKSATASPEPGIAESTVSCTSWPSRNSAIPPNRGMTERSGRNLGDAATFHADVQYRCTQICQALPRTASCGR